MHIDIVPNRNSHPAILLRESYRDENGKVKKRTHANLTHALEHALKFCAILQGADLAESRLEDAFDVLETLPHGHVVAVLQVCHDLQLPALLGRLDTEERRNSLALILGRILHPGSKLALSRHLGGSASTLSQELELDPGLDEDDLYAAMRWLWERQGAIEQRLAKKHLTEGCVVLYDLSSSYYEGSHCPLAHFGHNRDKKRGKKQINYGVLATAEGCPVAIEVYPGNTSDPATVGDQLVKLRRTFGLSKAIVIGDRGMLTSARLDLAAEDPGLADYGWISALRSGQIRKLVDSGDLQPELFDQCGLAEIKSDDFPGERLVVCRNPALAEERRRKRLELLDISEKRLAEIQAACRRERNPYKGKDKIARRIEREVGKYKMLKHFDLVIGEESLEYARKKKNIDDEATLDGFYVIRSRHVSEEEMGTEKLVESYKSLSGVERVFRNMKLSSLKVRPIFHREEDMVKAHLFLCMLAAHVQWHMEKKLAPLLFADEELDEQKARRENPVEKTERSAKAKGKADSKRTGEKQRVHSFRTMLEELGALSRITCKPKIRGAKTFTKVSEPNREQQKAFELLGVKWKR